MPSGVTAFKDIWRRTAAWLRRSEHPREEERLALKEKNASEATRAEAAREEQLRSMPVHITLGHSARCNLSCIMCFQRLCESRPDQRLDDHLLDLAIEEGLPYAQVVSTTVSGEPFLDPRIGHILQACLNHGVKASITTNGTVMPEKLLAEYISTFGGINVSLNAATESTYRSICVGGDFQRVMANIRLFHRYRQSLPAPSRPGITLSFIMMRRNIKEMPLFVRLAKELGADHVNFSHMIILSKEMEAESLLQDPSFANAMMDEAEALATELGVAMCCPPGRIKIEPVASDHVPAPSTESVGICPFLWKNVWIEWNGDVVPCCYPSPKRPTMGRIGQQSLRDIWNCDMYRRMRRGFRDGDLHPACHTCPHRTKTYDTNTATMLET